jgi:DNA-binding XRE family transcriptional regulator
MKNKKFSTFQQYKKKALKDPEFRKVFEAADEDPYIQIAHQLVTLRTKLGLTQAQLAKKTKTSQQAIARLESLSYRGYSVATLDKIADALKKKLKIQFV